ncbi:hypothetical protein AMAG_03517 [Allomyces macrogynus ATCC 38327]|uniref:RING-type domain-containing protein n=1 Tax=Allomyces macrogynus (strain ATCC 38327) TaxID=578462 RepID=A0A0L0S9A6_ALLM3|nr:hypothetical protein AMAG_03517 [Allomyces macrogynus ATCC 38327]|eukprot:KNE59193.1 hypothetical protein AMAG_03517 [Allomyces macrogynus ATCC 38327]
MTDDELNQLIVADFAELEARDPYAQRVKRVQHRAEHATYGEKVNDDGFAVSPVVVRRTLLKKLMLILNKDAYWRHDGDWPEEPGLNAHQDSYAAGRLLLVSTGGNLLKVWTSELNQYYRVVLRHQGPNTLETRAARTNRGSTSPDTLEAGDAAASTPPGFQLELYDYQQRSLAWLLVLELSQRARNISVHRLTYATPGAQKAQFQACGQLGVADWVQLGPGGMFVNVSNCAIAADPSVWRDRILPLSDIECCGALEVSRMGAGKTVMALALVAANPFRSVRDLPWTGIDRTQYLVSRATLVVVRSDLVAQWAAEAERVVPEGAKIVSMATIRDYRGVSWNDVLLADVVIVSVAFLQNSNYQSRIAKLVKTRRGRYCLPRAAYEDPPEGAMLLGFPKRWRHWRHAPNPDDYEHVNAQIDLYMADLHARGRAAFGTGTNCAILERVYWHRIVIDEIHELSHVQCAAGSPPTSTRVAETLLFTLQARFRLGLTGTPPVTHVNSVAALAEAVGVRDVPTRAMDVQAWLTSHARRNHPDLHVPRDEVVAVAGETATSVDEVAARVQGTRMERMGVLVARGRRQQVELAELLGRIRALIEVVPPEELADLPKNTGLALTADRRLMALDADVDSWLQRLITIPEGPGADAAVDHDPVTIPDVDVSQIKDLPADAVATARRIVRVCADLAETHAQLRSVAAQFRFMATVLAAIRDADAQSCPVCIEDVPRGQPIIITRCGHVFCAACADAMLAQSVRVCAICRGDLAGAGATIRMVMQRDADRDGDVVMDDGDQDEDDSGIDYAKYGSKIQALVRFVRRVVHIDATAKLILFSQFHQLTALMSQAFAEFGIGHAKFMGGHVIAKQRAIARFRHEPETKVLFLSAEDSVSGLQLIEANHVVIVHPFLGASEAMARAYEMQGCARAIRAGQTREVTVTRFVTRGTVEEELTARRSDLRHGEQLE